MSAISSPLVPRFNALHAPATLATGEVVSANASAVTLCGMVIKAPLKLGKGSSALISDSNCGASHAIGTTTALIPASAK